jgi:hypothetical protein
MADLVITTANVKISNSNTRVVTVLAGEAIAIGQAVYLDTANSEYLLADGSDATKANMAGIALTAAADAGYFLMLTSNVYVVGATLVAGTPYYLSDTAGAGAICPHADLLTGDFVTLLGHAISTTEIQLDIQALGIAVA